MSRVLPSDKLFDNLFKNINLVAFNYLVNSSVGVKYDICSVTENHYLFEC